MEKLIKYCGQPAKINCDENCNKAWGGSMRPRVYLEDPDQLIFGFKDKGDCSVWPSDEKIDPDNYAYLADHELGDAPINPGSYENFQGKPTEKSQIPNAWCIGECERCAMSDPGKYNDPLPLRDFSKRSYNMPWKEPKEPELNIFIGARSEQKSLE